MKKIIIGFLSIFVFAIIAFSFKNVSIQKENNPWSDQQLMPPDELAKFINEGTNKKMYIYSIGPSGLIKTAIEIGDGNDEKNMDKLKNEISSLPKDANIVVYCGCCPFEHCPNIRPVFNLFNEMKFTNHKLLNLPQNLKVDWIDKGYPMAEQ